MAPVADDCVNPVVMELKSIDWASKTGGIVASVTDDCVISAVMEFKRIDRSHGGVDAGASSCLSS